MLTLMTLNDAGIQILDFVLFDAFQLCCTASLSSVTVVRPFVSM